MKKRICAIFLATLTSLSLVACGSRSDFAIMSDSKSAYAPAMAGGTNNIRSNAVYEEYAEEEMAAYDMDMVDVSYNDNGSSVETTENATTSNRKLIKTVSLDVETKQFDSLVNNLVASVEKLGGYVENMNSYNGSSFNDYNSAKNANFTVRIPADRLDEFIGVVGEQSNITSKSEYVEDITLQYVDTESHKNMLIAERDRLTELLEQAETVEDIITIEDRLTYIRYEIDSMESQLRTYDNQVDYSTVNIYVQEVIDYTETTPQDELTTWERISTGFVKSLKDVGKGIKKFFINLIIDLPYLVIWAVVIIVVILIIKGLLKLFPKHREKSAAKKAAKKEKKAAKKEKKAAKKAAKKDANIDAGKEANINATVVDAKVDAEVDAGADSVDNSAVAPEVTSEKKN